MELGNFIFGNSRGEYPVARDGAWRQASAALHELLDQVAVHGPFENDVFSIRPYYSDLDCECGYDEREAEWSETHHHAADCYQEERRAAVAAAEQRLGYNRPGSLQDVFAVEHVQEIPEIPGATLVSLGPRGTEEDRRKQRVAYDAVRKEEQRISQELCAKHGIPWNDGAGSAVHCTCTHNSEWRAWSAANDHAETCVIVLPNFHHKASGYKLKWYKYPLRDSYANVHVSAEQVLAMIDQCKTSLAGGLPRA
jgi:hypothetical protein